MAVGGRRRPPQRLCRPRRFRVAIAAESPGGFRDNGDPGAIAAGVRDAVQSLDPSLVVADVRLMDDIADNSLSTARFALFLMVLRGTCGDPRRNRHL